MQADSKAVAVRRRQKPTFEVVCVYSPFTKNQKKSRFLFLPPFRYEHSHAMPFKRGSSAVAEWFERALYGAIMGEGCVIPTNRSISSSNLDYAD
jgi:hypothetical protein